MLLLETSNKNTLTLRHSTGKKVVFYYRDPEAEDQIDYHNSTLKRDGNAFVYDPSRARLNGGKAVLTGIGEGLLGVPDGAGGITPISSDPESPNYAEGWRELVVKHLPAELMLLGAFVFDGSRIVGSEDAEGKLPEILPQ